MSETIDAVGAEAVVVELRDGQVETVSVKALTIREMQRYLPIAEDTAASIEYLCGKEKGWADKLTQASARKVVESGDRVNRDFFEWLLRREVDRQAKLFPEATAQIEKLIAGMVGKSLSDDGSPRSLPDAA